MEKHWINKQGGDKLLIFVLGWAADHRVVENIRPQGFDILCVYDYREMVPFSLTEIDEIQHYPSKYLFAWSFGVWAAEQLLADVAFTRSIALNGTPFPVDDRFGIPPRVLDITSRGLATAGTDTFNRRAYDEYYDTLRPVLPPRPDDQNLRELTRLRDLSTVSYIPQIRWDRAIVGERDRIFPPENMKNYWLERAQLLPLPHYPFGDAGLIEKLI